MPISPSQLAAINLKFGGHAKPLKQLALADLVAHALFILNRSANVNDIAVEAARIVGLPGIDNRLVDEALDYLNTDKKVKKNGREWVLTTETYALFQREQQTSERALEEMLDRHFPGSINRDVLKAWFFEGASAFFGFNAAESLKSISRNTRVQFARPQTIRELLQPSIRSAGLVDQEEALVAAFSGFLESQEPADYAYIAQLTFALFSAQLISAETGADPIGIDEIRDATFILDTNALLAIKQDGHRFSTAINALGLALTEIGAELIYLNTTRQEYGRVFNHKKNDIAARFREYDAELVLDANDDFIKSGVLRGCTTPEDFDRYFAEVLQDMPTELPSGPSIREKDDDLIEAAAKRAEVDTKLKVSLQKHRRLMLRHEKSEAGLCHDATLLHVVDVERKTKAKTWVLTLDRSLRACAVEQVGPHGEPTVFMLDGLIQMLAVYSGGPNRRAEEFAPLLTNILINRCTPSDQTYSIDDLAWLHTIQERAADFPPEKVKKILELITRHRLSGASDDRKLELAVNRMYQDEKREYEAELAEARDGRRAAEQEVETVRTQLAATTATLAGHEEQDCRRIARKKVIRNLAWRLPVALMAAIIVLGIGLIAFPTNGAEVLPWLASLAAFVGAFRWLCWKPIAQYRIEVKTCSHL